MLVANAASSTVDVRLMAAGNEGDEVEVAYIEDKARCALIFASSLCSVHVLAAGAALPNSSMLQSSAVDMNLVAAPHAAAACALRAYFNSTTARSCLLLADMCTTAQPNSPQH
jgi:hypothetical protein